MSTTSKKEKKEIGEIQTLLKEVNEIYAGFDAKSQKAKHLIKALNTLKSPHATNQFNEPMSDEERQMHLKKIKSVLNDLK